MADHTRIVETQFVPLDKGTSRTLDRIAEKAKHADERLGELSGTVAMMAGATATLGAALSLERMVDTTNEYFQSLKRLKSETGLATQKAAGLKEALELGGGLEGGEAERLLLSLARKGEAMEGAMGRGGGMMSRQIKRLGVDIKHGPEAALLSMADAAEKGKLTTANLSRTFGIRNSSAVSLMGMLEKGSSKIRDIEEHTMRVTDSDLEAFTRIQMLRREIKNSWEDIQVTIAKRLFPVTERLMTGVRDKMDGWMESAEKFGNILERHLETGLSVATTLGKVLLANYSLQRANSGRGILASAMQLGQWVLPGGRLLREPAAMKFDPTGGKGDQDIFQLVRMANYRNAVRRGESPMDARWRQVRETGGALFGKAKEAFQVAQPAVSGMLRLGGLATGLAFAAGTVKGILDSINGVESQSARNWQDAADNMRLLGELSEGVFGPGGWMAKFLADPTSVTAKVLTGAMAELTMRKHAEERFDAEEKAARGSGWAAKLSNAAKGLAGYTPMAGPMALYSNAERERRIGQYMEEELSRAQDELARKKAASEVMKFSVAETQTREKAPVFDFRNSKFDILQKFEEGFDPDRIAAAFAGDLAGLGEMAVQSGFTPLFSVHG